MRKKILTFTLLITLLSGVPSFKAIHNTKALSAQAINVTNTSTSDVRSYYSALNSKSESERKGDALLTSLKPILKGGHVSFSYDTVWDWTRITDRDWEQSPLTSAQLSNYGFNDNPYVKLLYRSDNGTPTAAHHQDSHNEVVNREHVWAKSVGNFGETAPAGTDLHHLILSDVKNNSSHGNDPFGEPTTYNPVVNYVGDYTGKKGTVNHLGNTYSVYEPQDSDKGDIARAMFYMAARYSSYTSVGDPYLKLTNTPSTGVITSNASTPGQGGILDTLLKWHTQDPVDDYEIKRNNLIYNNAQFNRNPFIDYPSWVDAVWGSKTAVNPLTDVVTQYGEEGEEPGEPGEPGGPTEPTEPGDANTYTEGFDSLASSGSYAAGTYTGVNGQEWTYGDSRTDQTITGPAVTVRNNTLSTTFPNGLKSLEFDYKKFFGGSGGFTVKVNGVVKETKSGLTEDTAGNVTINDLNLTGNVVLEITTTERVGFDNIKWTEYYGVSNPVLVTSLTVNPQSKTYSTNDTLLESNFTVSVIKDGIAGTNADYTAKIGSGSGSNFSGTDIVWGTTKPKVTDTKIQFKAKYPSTAGGSTYLTAEVLLTVSNPVFATLSSIAIKTPANTTSYSVGDSFSSAGLVLNASDNSTPVITKDVTSGYTTNFDGVTFNASHIGNKTVIVSYKEGSITKTVNYTITVSAASTEKIYKMITSADELQLGANYVIGAVVGSKTYAMTTVQNSNNRGSKEAELSGGKIVEDENIQKVQLVDGTTSNTFGFRTVNGTQGYLYAASSSSNYLKTQSTLDDNASWLIEINGSNHSATAQGANTRNQLKYNSGNNPPIFSAYGSGQVDISLWVDESSIVRYPSVSITSDVSEVEEGKTLQLSASTENADGAAINWSINDSTVATINSTTGLLMALKAGSVVVTASIVVGGNTYTNTIEITVTANPYDHEGTAADPFSVKDALLKAEETGSTETSEDFYVKGIISEITEVNTTNYGNATFKIKDSLGDSVYFTAFRVKWGASGANFTTETAKNIVVGYEVTLVGKIIKYLGTTPELNQNSKVLSVDKTPAIYAETKEFVDWMMDSLRDSEECEEKFIEAWYMWNDLSEDAKEMFVIHTDFEGAEARLSNWAIANGETFASLNNGAPSPKDKSNTTTKDYSSLAATIIIGVIGLTTLLGYYFLKKRQTQN